MKPQISRLPVRRAQLYTLTVLLAAKPFSHFVSTAAEVRRVSPQPSEDAARVLGILGGAGGGSELVGS